MVMKKKQTTKMEPVPLDGGYGWVVVLGSFLIHVFADGFLFSFGILANPLIKEFEASDTYLSFILSLLIGLMLGTGCLASVACHRFGCRIVTIFGALIASAGCAATYLARSITYTVFSVGIVMGVGVGFMYCAAIIIVTLYFEERRSLATGITVCGAGVGTFVFSQVIGLLTEAFGWRLVFLIYAGILLLCIPCGLLFRPIQMRAVSDNNSTSENFGDWRKSSMISNRIFGDKIQPRISSQDLTQLEDSIFAEQDDMSARKNGVITVSVAKNSIIEPPKQPKKKSPLLRSLDISLLRDPVFWLFTVSIFFGMAGYDAPTFLMPRNAKVILDMKNSSSDTITVYGFTNTIGRIGFGVLCDLRLPESFGFGRNCAQNRLVIYAVAMILCGLSSSTVLIFHSVKWFMSYCAFFGFTISSFMCLWSVILIDLVGYRRLTSAFSMLLFVQGIANFVGTPISGHLYDITKRYELSFVFCGMLQVLSGLAMLCILPIQMLRRKRRLIRSRHSSISPSSISNTEKHRY